MSKNDTNLGVQKKLKTLILSGYIDKEGQKFLVKFFSKKTGTGQTKIDLTNQGITDQDITDKRHKQLTKVNILVRKSWDFLGQ